MPEELLTIKLALTPKEAAALTPIGENTIRRLCREDPSFPAFKNGADYIISRKLFEDWLSFQADSRTGFPGAADHGRYGKENRAKLNKLKRNLASRNANKEGGTNYG